LTLAGFRDLFGGAGLAEARISAALLGGISAEGRKRELPVERRQYLACIGPDCLGKVEINEPFIEVGVGAARYGDLNSDLPICITQDFLLIQSVTGLTTPLKGKFG